jgi:uncharacterized membrane protein
MRSFLLINGIVFLVLFLGKAFLPGALFHQEIWTIFIFFLCVSFLHFRLMSLGLANQKEHFINFFLANVVLNLILSLVFIGVYLYLKVADQEKFIASFFALYLCYTGFEMWINLRKLRQNS